MKKLILCLVLLSLPILTACATQPGGPHGPPQEIHGGASPYLKLPPGYNYKNQPDGFNGIKWDMSIEEAEKAKGVKFELVYHNISLDSKIYSIPGDKNEFFGVSFPDLTYTFKSNKYKRSSTKLYVPDPDQAIYKKLVADATALYGEPTGEAIINNDVLKTEWRGTKTYMHITHDGKSSHTGIYIMAATVAYF